MALRVQRAARTGAVRGASILGPQGQEEGLEKLAGQEEGESQGGGDTFAKDGSGACKGSVSHLASVLRSETFVAVNFPLFFAFMRRV